ncbi:MAG: UDP-2,4-diacetamido-2,4,6-trideoxy-beta-L-altropyranose hydrolase [Anaerolineaceae bacterium]|nr:UDP-2,4-diacetamido-2,4,6-trideoxy-beta-L-altropyranose hydrolase [Anaerolineaceae bacterium]
MRSLALAQAWRDSGGRAALVMSDESQPWSAPLRAEGLEVVRWTGQSGGAEDARETVRVARQRGAEWVAVDGYHFGLDYQQVVKAAGLHLLAIDDYGHADHYLADIVLNQNAYADPSYYADREPTTRLLLGTRYALLRRPFNEYRSWRRDIPEVARRVLVTLGGSAPGEVVAMVVEALDLIEVEGLEADVVCGGGAGDCPAALQEKARRAGCTIRLIPGTDRMHRLMAAAEVAISAGGSTSWELAFMGLAGLMVVLADNQQAVVDRLSRDGVAEDLGPLGDLRPQGIADSLKALILSPERRRRMSRRGRQLVDGRGAARVADQVRGPLFTIRRAVEADCETIWHWANDPQVRRQSFSPGEIPWDDHLAWFNGKLSDPDHVFYVVTNGSGRPIGQVRYEIDGGQAICSVSLAPECRGRGFGSRVLGLASGRVMDESGLGVVHAYIKQGNEQSVRAFLKAGFSEIESVVYRECPSRHLVLSKGNGP